jgi:hypothetical protein
MSKRHRLRGRHSVEGGRTLQATVGQSSFLTLRLDGKVVTKLSAGTHTVAVADKFSKDNFHLSGTGVNKSTSVCEEEERHLDPRAAEGDLPLFVRRELEADRDVPRRLGGSA